MLIKSLRLRSVSLCLAVAGVSAATSEAHAVDYQWILTSPKQPATVWVSSPPVGQALSQQGISAINNSGMSSSIYATDKHSDVAEDMWSTTANDPAPEFRIDLKSVSPIGKMVVWNYAWWVPNWGSFSGRGIKDCKIFYSEDNIVWKQLMGPGAGGIYTLAKANQTGPNQPQAASNQANGLGPVDFKGRAARYISIKPVVGSNWGGAAGETDKYYGLSEVRVYRYGQSNIVAGSNIPARVAMRSTDPNGREQATTNNADMSDEGSGVYADTASVGTNNHWISAANDASPYIVYDLGGTYPLDRMSVWNLNMVFNGGSWTNSGLKNVKIYTSVGRGVPLYAPNDLSGWTLVKNASGGDTHTLKQAAGRVGQLKTDTVAFDNRLAQYVLIVPQGGVGSGNYGGGYYGLSQVRFYAGRGYAAEPAPQWNAMVSQRSKTEHTYVGGDGAYSVPYSTPTGSKSLFMFDDASVGTWNPTTYQGFVSASANNTYAIYDAASSTPWKFQNQGATIATIKPVSRDGVSRFYWMQGGFYDTTSSSIYLPAARGTTAGHDGATIIKLPIANGVPKFSDANLETHQYQTGLMSDTVGFVTQLAKFGSYVYLYGSRDGGKLIVARFTLANINNRNAWEFRSGSSWVPYSQWMSATSILPPDTIGGVWGNVTLNPDQSDPKKKYVFTTARRLSPSFPLPLPVSLSFAEFPEGPFSPFTDLFVPQEASTKVQSDPTMYPGTVWYAASNHPELALPGEMLITVNLNYGDGTDALKYAPKFYRVRKL